VTIAEIRSLADVRPGDICLTRMGGFIPGLLPVRIGHAICKESFTIGPFSADHVLICVQEDRSVGKFGDAYALYRPARAVQAMPRGAEEIALRADKHWTDGVAWFRLTEDYPGQAEDAAAIARLFVTEKVPYSFLSYVALAAWSRGLKAERLERWIDRRGEVLPAFKRRGPWPEQLYTPQLPKEAICSVLADQAWSLAGKRVMEGVKRQCVTPGAMAIQLSKRYKAYGPGFL
jgi:hypothetical protein